MFSKAFSWDAGTTPTSPPIATRRYDVPAIDIPIDPDRALYIVADRLSAAVQYFRPTRDPRDTDLVLMVQASENQAFRSRRRSYLNKPVAWEDLLEKVQGLLEARRLIRRMYKVLIVDDDPAIRTVCCEVLKQHGYAVFEAGSGRQALEMLRNSSLTPYCSISCCRTSTGPDDRKDSRRSSSAAVPIIFS